MRSGADRQRQVCIVARLWVAAHDAAGEPTGAVGGERTLTECESAVAQRVFGQAIDDGRVTSGREKWFPAQPRQVVTLA